MKMETKTVLGRIHAALSDILGEAKGILGDKFKLTLVARYDGELDGHIILTEDALERVIEVLAKRMAVGDFGAARDGGDGAS